MSDDSESSKWKTICTVCGCCVHDHGGWGHSFTNDPNAPTPPDVQAAWDRAREMEG